MMFFQPRLCLVAGLAWAVTTKRVTERYDFREGGGANGIATVAVSYGAELAENGAIFAGPVPLTTPQPALDATGFDAQTSATEATADGPVFGNSAIRPLKMVCITAATLAAGESIVITLRAAAASVQAGGSDFACTIGVAALGCETTVEGETFIPANTATALRAVMASNNADGEDVACVVYYQVD